MNLKLFWLVVLGLVVWRVGGWWMWHRGLSAGDEINGHMRVVQVDQRWSYAVMKWRGVRIECPIVIDGCERLFEVPELTQVKWTGRVEDWVIQGENIGKKVDISSIELVSTGEDQIWSIASFLLQGISSLTDRVADVYRSYLGEPAASLMAGIVLGSREEMPQDFYDALVVTGTLHIIAASGYNITVVAQALLYVCLQFLRRKQALIVSVAGIFLYVIMAGMSPAVVRAGIMGLLVFGAQGFGRVYAAWYGLALAAVGMLLAMPWMVADVSFQLSIAATAGLMLGVEPMRRAISVVLKTPMRWGVKRDLSTAKHLEGALLARDDTSEMEILLTLPEEDDETGLLVHSQEDADERSDLSKGLSGLVEVELATTLAATLATLPITLVTFGRVSLISPLANMLVVALVPPIMALGAIIGSVGLVLPVVSEMVSWMAWPLLELFVKIIEWSAMVPMASVEVEGVSWWVGVGIWLVLLGWWSHRTSRRN